MLSRNLKVLTIAYLCIAVVGWLLFANSMVGNPEKAKLVSRHCSQDALLIKDIVQALDEFTPSAGEENQKRDALIASYEAWHSFWQSSKWDAEMDRKMTPAEHELMNMMTRDLDAAQKRFWRNAESGSNLEDHGETYNEVRKLQATNPLAE